MDLIYAMGGGMGHLTRVEAFVRSLHLVEFKVFSSNQHLYNLFPKEKCITVPDRLEHDATAFFSYLKTFIVNGGIRRIFIDTFPNGILGELKGDELRRIGVEEVHWISRHLN